MYCRHGCAVRTLATSCAPSTSEKDASLAAVLTEHDPGLSPEKSAKSTLCARTHTLVVATHHHHHQINKRSKMFIISIDQHLGHAPAWTPPCCAAGCLWGCATRREQRGWPSCAAAACRVPMADAKPARRN